jgi:hypothetical protein
MSDPQDREGAAETPATPKKAVEKVPAKTVAKRVPATKVPAKTAAAKSSAVKKTPAKKTPAKKTPANKAPAEKSAPASARPALKAPPPRAALTAGDSPARQADANVKPPDQRADTPAVARSGPQGDYRLPVSLGLAAAGLVALVLSRLRRG